MTPLSAYAVKQPFPWSMAARHFLIMFLPLLALVLAGAWFMAAAEGRRQGAKWLADESLQVQLGAGVLKYRVRQLNGDIHYLSRLPTLAAAMNRPDAANLARLAEDFQVFAESSQLYDQVRWLDETGMERVRIGLRDGRAQIVSRSALQDKSGRYYFRDAFGLPRGEVFLSPLDLNVEHGHIELPYKPMLRVGMPVFDNHGVKRGVVLLNYYGNQLLKRLREVTTSTTDHIMLLNRDGFWLVAPNPADEWGFMFGRKETFASRHPQVWHRILAEESGQFEDSDGLWTFTTLHPLDTNELSSTGSAAANAPSAGKLGPGGYFWKVVSHLPASRLAVGYEFLRQIVAACGLILALLAVGTGWLVRARLRENLSAAKLTGLNQQLVREVTERTLTEQSARRQEAYLDSLVRTAPDAIIVIDCHGRVELCNPELERLFGYQAGELAGQSVNLLIPPGERDAHDGYMRRYLETGEAHVIGVGREVEGLHKDGRPLALYLKIGETGSGEERRFVGFLHDISARKRAEAEREHYLAELERSNRELDDFAYVASHDLKEPLRGIHNYASFVIEDYADLLPQDGQDKLHTLTRLTARMEMLINDLLYYSRVGRWELKSGAVDMNAMLEQAREALAACLAESGGRIEVPRPLPPAWGDPIRIPEIFQNLIGNALKYNDRADKRVEVGWLDSPDQARQPAAHDQRVYYVRDNGIGIREKHLDSVFRIFKRLHGRDQYGGGSGAGLTITRKILHRLGGHIWVESVYGEGSTFYFTLPAEGQALQEEVQGPSRVSPAEAIT